MQECISNKRTLFFHFKHFTMEYNPFGFMYQECTDHVPVVLAVRPHDGGDEEQQGAEDGHLQGHQLEQQQRPPAHIGTCDTRV